MSKISETIASFVSAARFSDLPEFVCHEMRRLILDSMGCAVAGHTTERGAIAADLARKLGGPAEAGIIGTRDKVSSANAAFANGELMNALDFDALSNVGRHDVPTLIAATVATAERIGASGKELVTATALALEISGRIKSAVLGMHAPGPEAGKMLWPAVNGYSSASLGAAAGVAKLLNLDQVQIANAVGIAGYMCPPNTMRKWVETTPVRMIKYGPPGWGAQVGVTAALLAEMGYLGDSDLFDGDFGFWRYTGKDRGKWDADKVIKDLDTHWCCHEIIYKQYPSGL
jgi:2-methylcitrate dehydratase PrpD